MSGEERKAMVLPEPDGPVVVRTEKVYVPVEQHPDVSDAYCGPLTHPYFQFNFVGRILGPRGMTAKQLEQETGCKIMVRGRGSIRDKKKVSGGRVRPALTCACGQEEQNRGKPNWEHLNDKLHVLVTAEDSENRASVKLDRAIAEVKRLLVPMVSDSLACASH